MIWLGLVLIAIFSNSATRILQKSIMSKSNIDPVAFSLVSQLITGLIIFIWSLFVGFEIPFSSLKEIFPFLVLMSFLYTIGNIYTFKAFQTIPASEAAIILATSSIWTIVAANIFLREQLTQGKFIGILFLLFGVILIQFKSFERKLNTGHLFAFVASISYGIAFVVDALIINKFNNTFSYLVWAFLLPGLGSIFFKPSIILTAKSIIRKDNFIKIIFASTLFAITSIAFYTSYTVGGNASIISPLSQVSVLITVIFSYFVLKEKDDPIRKLLAAILVIFGAVLTVL